MVDLRRIYLRIDMVTSPLTLMPKFKNSESMLLREGYEKFEGKVPRKISLNACISEKKTTKGDSLYFWSGYVGMRIETLEIVEHNDARNCRETTIVKDASGQIERG